ncbi:MAG: response regulator [Pseudomonadota bacterium]
MSLPSGADGRELEAAPGLNSLKGAPVLVVEDDPTSALLACHLLQREGLEVVHVRDGEAAVTAFEKHHPQLVLTDVSLGDESGITIAERLRQIERARNGTPAVIVALTADDSPTKRALDRDGVLNAFLRKPLRIEAVTALLAASRARPPQAPAPAATTATPERGASAATGIAEEISPQIAASPS